MRRRSVARGASPSHWFPPGWRPAAWGPPRRAWCGLFFRHFARLFAIYLAILVTLVLFMLAVRRVGAEEVKTPCDPSKTVCFTTEGWILGQRTWSLGAEPRDLPGSRLQAEAHWKRWRFAGRADATGLPGTYEHGKLETVAAIEAHLAASWDALVLPDRATIGPAVAVGTGTPVESQEGVKIETPKRLTAGVGVRVSWPKGWAYGVVGQHQSLRGVAAVVTWQIKAGDRMANIGTVAIAAGGHYVATIGIAVRFH